jgi:hypothetical protein
MSGKLKQLLMASVSFKLGLLSIIPIKFNGYGPLDQRTSGL